MLGPKASLVPAFGILIAIILTVTATPAMAIPPAAKNFVAPLDGGQEVGPVDTKATGLAKFQMSDDGTELQFKLIVANIANVFAAHIHCGARGINGPVGVTLFFNFPPVTENGILAQGTRMAPDSGNGCGWADLAAVVAAMQSGDTYVNVHTLPANPGGEIRGQILVAGPK